MKLLTKEEEDAHYRATLQGGVLGGLGGLALGTVAVMGAARRFSAFNSLTLQMKAFLITSSGTFAGIIAADHGSRAFETARNPADQAMATREQQKRHAELARMSWTERAMDLGRKERYKIVGVAWLASMAGSFALVSRNRYLTGPQKVVQARVYAQALTLLVVIATASFEVQDSRQGKGKYETVEYVDEKHHKRTKQVEREQPPDGDPLWKDMVAAEEDRLRERDDAIRDMEEKDHRRKAKGDKHRAGNKTTDDHQHDKKKQDDSPEGGKEGKDKDGPKDAKKDEKKKQPEEDERDEEEEEEEYHPIPGKKGEGKMMSKASDPPDPNVSAVP